MKDFYKKAFFYYVITPLLAAFWPLLLWAVYLPLSQRAWEKERADYARAELVITEILSLDPERLHITDGKTGGQFDYANAVQKVASLYHVPPANYKLASGMLITTSGRKSQSARVSLKDISVSQVANFLSTIQLHWPDLQCNTLKLTKRKDTPDSWDADFDFKYFF